MTASISLLLEAPDREWARQVQSLIQHALGGAGSLTLGVLGEGLENRPKTSSCFVAGIVECDEPEDRMLAAIRWALLDFEVQTRRLDSGLTQIVVRPFQRRDARVSR